MTEIIDQDFNAIVNYINDQDHKVLNIHKDKNGQEHLFAENPSMWSNYFGKVKNLVWGASETELLAIVNYVLNNKELLKKANESGYKEFFSLINAKVEESNLKDKYQYITSIWMNSIGVKVQPIDYHTVKHKINQQKSYLINSHLREYGQLKEEGSSLKPKVQSKKEIDDFISVEKDFDSIIGNFYKDEILRKLPDLISTLDSSREAFTIEEDLAMLDKLKNVRKQPLSEMAKSLGLSEKKTIQTLIYLTEIIKYTKGKPEENWASFLSTIDNEIEKRLIKDYNLPEGALNVKILEGITSKELSQIPFSTLQTTSSIFPKSAAKVDLRALEEFIHVMGDSFALDSGLEGSQSKNFIPIINGFLKEFEDDPEIKALIDTYQAGIDLRKADAKTVLKDIQELHKKDQPALLFAGWDGHAIAYEIIKESEKKVTLRLYNSGDAIEGHHLKVTDGIHEKYSLCYELHGIDADKLLNETYLQYLIDFTAYKKEVPPPGTVLYNYLLPLLGAEGDYSQEGKEVAHFLQKGQKSGTCSYGCLIAHMAHHVESEEKYKKLKLGLHLYMMKGAYNALKDKKDLFPDFDLKKADDALGIIRRALEKMSASTVKLMNREYITSKEAEEIKQFSEEFHSLLNEVESKISAKYKKEKEQIPLKLDPCKVTFQYFEDYHFVEVITEKKGNIIEEKGVQDEKFEKAISEQAFSIKMMEHLNTAIEYLMKDKPLSAGDINRYLKDLLDLFNRFEPTKDMSSQQIKACKEAKHAFTTIAIKQVLLSLKNLKGMDFKELKPKDVQEVMKNIKLLTQTLSQTGSEKIPLSCKGVLDSKYLNIENRNASYLAIFRLNQLLYQICSTCKSDEEMIPPIFDKKMPFIGFDKDDHVLSNLFSSDPTIIQRLKEIQNESLSIKTFEKVMGGLLSLEQHKGLLDWMINWSCAPTEEFQDLILKWYQTHRDKKEFAFIQKKLSPDMVFFSDQQKAVEIVRVLLKEKLDEPPLFLQSFQLAAEQVLYLNMMTLGKSDPYKEVSASSVMSQNYVSLKIFLSQSEKKYGAPPLLVQALKQLLPKGYGEDSKKEDTDGLNEIDLFINSLEYDDKLHRHKDYKIQHELSLKENREAKIDHDLYEELLLIRSSSETQLLNTISFFKKNIRLLENPKWYPIFYYLLFESTLLDNAVKNSPETISIIQKFMNDLSTELVRTNSLRSHAYLQYLKAKLEFAINRTHDQSKLCDTDVIHKQLKGLYSKPDAENVQKDKEAYLLSLLGGAKSLFDDPTKTSDEDIGKVVAYTLLNNQFKEDSGYHLKETFNIPHADALDTKHALIAYMCNLNDTKKRESIVNHALKVLTQCSDIDIQKPLKEVKPNIFATEDNEWTLNLVTLQLTNTRKIKNETLPNDWIRKLPDALQKLISKQQKTPWKEMQSTRSGYLSGTGIAFSLNGNEFFVKDIHSNKIGNIYLINPKSPEGPHTELVFPEEHYKINIHFLKDFPVESLQETIVGVTSINKNEYSLDIIDPETFKPLKRINSEGLTDLGTKLKAGDLTNKNTILNISHQSRADIDEKGEIQELHLDYLGLNFKRQGELLLCQEMPGWHIAKDQFLDRMRGVSGTLLIENSKKEKKVIIPNRDVITFKKESLGRSARFNEEPRLGEVQPDYASFFTYTVNKQEELIPQTLAGRYQLATLYIATGQYERAEELLRPVHAELSTRKLTEEEEDTLKNLMAIKMGSGYHDTSIHSVYLRLLASYYYFNNRLQFGGKLEDRDFEIMSSQFTSYLQGVSQFRHLPLYIETTIAKLIDDGEESLAKLRSHQLSVTKESSKEDPKVRPVELIPPNPPEYLIRIASMIKEIKEDENASLIIVSSFAQTDTPSAREDLLKTNRGLARDLLDKVLTGQEVPLRELWLRFAFDKENEKSLLLALLAAANPQQKDKLNQIFQHLKQDIKNNKFDGFSEVAKELKKFIESTKYSDYMQILKKVGISDQEQSRIVLERTQKLEVKKTHYRQGDISISQIQLPPEGLPKGKFLGLLHKDYLVKSIEQAKDYKKEFSDFLKTDFAETKQSAPLKEFYKHLESELEFAEIKTESWSFKKDQNIDGLTKKLQNYSDILSSSLATKEKTILEEIEKVRSTDTKSYLEKMSGRQKEISIDLLCTLFACSDFKKLVKIEYPFLSDKACGELEKALFSYLKEKQVLQQTNRALSAAVAIGSMNSSLKSDEVQIQMKRLALELSNEPAYDPNDLSNRAVLVFECARNMLLRKEQQTAINHLKNLQSLAAVIQAIMGFGKSDVVQPLYVGMEENQVLSAVIAPAEQIGSLVDKLKASLGSAFVTIKR